MAAIVIACLIVAVAAAPASSAAPTRGKGYWVASTGAVLFAFGDGAALVPRDPLRQLKGQIADIATHPSGRGAWLLARDGAVYAYGESRDFGSADLRNRGEAIAIAPSRSGNGYLVATDLGDVLAFGDAVASGSLGGKILPRRVADMAATPTGLGYWLVDTGGQVTAFGDARAFGSLGASGGQGDVVALAATPRGDGYWIVTAKGDVTGFGAAVARGGATTEVIDVASTYTGNGYWLLTKQGDVMPFGDAVFYGQPPRNELKGQAAAVASTPFVNHDPIANPDSGELDEDTALDINVLANDTDTDGDPLRVESVTQPSHGTATLNGDGSVRYAPTHDFNGTDAFTYRVVDGFGGSATGTVRLVIRPVNDAPVAADDVFTIDEDTPLGGSLVANDADVDGDALTGQLVTGPAHGTLTLGSDGTFVYVPAQNYNGDDSFTYRAFDGALASNAATVRIHINPVNDAPTALDDESRTLEDESVLINVLANDSDVDGDPITVRSVTPPAHGTLAFSGTGPITYTPAPDFNGADLFTYTIADPSGATTTATVRITVIPVNDPPVARGDGYETDEDVLLVVLAPGVLRNDRDVDGDALAVELVRSPAHGTLTLAPDGSFTYLPAADYNGDDLFIYRANDGAGGSAVATVTLRVIPVNDPPVASADELLATEDEMVTIGAPGVLANDSDVDSPALTAVVATPPSHGALSLAPDGSLTYMPDANFSGIDSFTYRASDGLLTSGEATVTIFVAPVNDPPVGMPDSFTIDEDTVLSVPAPGVLNNDTDVDGDTLRARLFEAPAHGDIVLQPDGSFEYRPDPNYNGTDTFTYEVTDGSIVVGGVTVTITINPVPDPPTAANDFYNMQAGTTPLTIAAPGVLANDFTDEGTLTAVLVTSVSSGTLTLNADGSFTYTTTRTTTGDDSFTYKATNGTVDSAPATVTIHVTAQSSGGGGPPPGMLGAAQGTLQVWDYDSLKLAAAGTPMKTAHGQVVKRPDGLFYEPERGFRGRDSFDFGGRHYEIDVLSDIWGD